jgi:hypothetical protein
MKLQKSLYWISSVIAVVLFNNCNKRAVSFHQGKLTFKLNGIQKTIEGKYFSNHLNLYTKNIGFGPGQENPFYPGIFNLEKKLNDTIPYSGDSGEDSSHVGFQKNLLVMPYYQGDQPVLNHSLWHAKDGSSNWIVIKRVSDDFEKIEFDFALSVYAVNKISPEVKSPFGVDTCIITEGHFSDY